MKAAKKFEDKNDVERLAKVVRDLDFPDKMELLRRVFATRSYRKQFYKYTEQLSRKYKIPKMTEKELDEFLHAP